jgi:AcrR family transcriptional regulator
MPITKSPPRSSTSATPRTGTREAIQEAGLRLFHQYGYAATSIRDIAKAANIGVASLFYHFPSKLSLLEAVIHAAMDGLIEATDQAYREAGPDPAAKLRAIVHAHVLFGINRGPEGLIGESELRALDDRSRADIVAKRDRQERTFTETIIDGSRRGVFEVANPRLASRAILTMCTGVTLWYRPHGTLTPDEIANMYADFALRIVAYRA